MLELNLKIYKQKMTKLKVFFGLRSLFVIFTKTQQIKKAKNQFYRLLSSKFYIKNYNSGATSS